MSRFISLFNELLRVGDGVIARVEFVTGCNFYSKFLRDAARQMPDDSRFSAKQ